MKPVGARARLRRTLLAFPRSERGAAAVEFALWLTVLIFPLLNIIDLGFYTYQGMQVQTAAEAAVDAAWHDCNANPLALTTPAAPPPATVTCITALNNETPSVSLVGDMRAAANSTSLGTRVGLASADISEAYSCPTSAGVIVQTNIGTAATAPNTAPAIPNCPGSTTPAGDYITAKVRFTYTPLLSNASIASLLGTNINRTAYLRLDK